MKILFAALMCLVLGGSQCFAISGGPVYPAGLNVVGTFAGVMLPPRTADLKDPTKLPDCSANSIAVFSIGVPQTGIASGAFVMFTQGQVFTGTVRGVADPGRSTLKGILNATFDFTVTNPNVNPPQEIQVTASANGSLLTTITNSSRSFGTAGTRLQGDATLVVSQGEVVNNLPTLTCQMNLKVVGFKQSDVVSTGT